MNEKLEQYRKEIDALDIELVDVLARRLAVVRAVGALKAETGLSVVQPERAKAVVDRAAEMGVEKGLSPDFIRALYHMMIDHAHVVEHDIIDEERS
ncbi:MAG: chorismate mutase [Alphaproteobacteria bacterium]